MKHRTKFVISGTMLNGKIGLLVIYAFSRQQAQDYADQHFRKALIN